MKLTKMLLIAMIAIITVRWAAVAQVDFYAGKRINLIIGFTSGGGVDAYGRLMARRIGAHIPGNPAVIPQNMPGAAGMVAVRSIEATQPKDGTAIVTFTPGLVVQAIMTPEQYNIDFSRYTWIGTVGQEQRVCYTWAATGIKTWDAFVKSDLITMGDTAGGPSTMTQRVLQRLFNVKLKSVLGYPGSAEKRLAIESGELDGDCSTINEIPAEWLKDHKIFPIIQFQRDMPSPFSEAVYAGDIVKSDPRKRQLLDLLNAASEIGRPFLVAHEVPGERVAILRKAFDDTMADPAFREDAAKLDVDITPSTGAGAQARVRSLYDMPPDLIAAARAVISN